MLKTILSNRAETTYFFFDTTAGKLLQTLPVALLISVIYLCVRLYVKRKGGETYSVWRDIVYMLFVGYFAELICLVLVPQKFWSYIWHIILFGWYDAGEGASGTVGTFNFIPAIYKIARGELTVGKWGRTMFVGNVLMFVPFGMMFPFVTHRREKIFWQTIKWSFLVIVIIEVIQPWIGRSFDVDDILCNLFGVMIGYGAFLVIKIALPNKVWQDWKG